MVWAIHKVMIRKAMTIYESDTQDILRRASGERRAASKGREVLMQRQTETG